jgi:hypothetical protein
MDLDRSEYNGEKALQLTTERGKVGEVEGIGVYNELGRPFNT